MGPNSIIVLKVGLRKKAELDVPVLWLLPLKEVQESFDFESDGKDI
jgi:hypothetical protein